MQSLLILASLALWSIPSALGQLNTIGVLTPGETLSSSTSASSSTVTTLSATSTLITPTSSSTAIATSQTSSVTEIEDILVLTTIFTQPSACSSGATKLVTVTDEIWLNVIDPVPTVLITSCYPSQFYSSALASTTSLPAFKQLVCPKDWETYNITSTYIICCPRGFGFYAPNYNDTERPGLGAICTSNVWPGVLLDITSYDATGVATIIGATAGPNGTLVQATAFDGTLATAIVTSTTSATLTTSSTATPSSTSSTVSLGSSSSITTFTTATTTTSGTTSSDSPTPTAITQLPGCGQTCFNNMLAQYTTLGCDSADPSCLCRNINFAYGIRDCSNGACGTNVASTVIAFEEVYCSSAIADHTTYPSTTTTTTTTAVSTIPTSIGDLPSCGQTCFSNMQAQYTTLGCSSPDPVCLCQNINFYYGIRDCSNAACVSGDAGTVIAFESAYCASATATATST